MAKNYIIAYTLNNIFHMMENGSLTVPAFQRPYVWSTKAVKELFESINSGYPIGMLIAVEHDSDHFESVSSELSLFPKADLNKLVSSKILWILDGSQRLTALYNVFLGNNERFTLLYDLEQKKFLFPQEGQDKTKLLNMSSLFKTEEFMQRQAKIAKFDDNEALLDELYAVHNRFKDYQVPIQVVAEVSDKDIVNIFAALNTSGITLSKDEIKRAMKYKKSN